MSSENGVEEQAAAKRGAMMVGGDTVNDGKIELHRSDLVIGGNLYNKGEIKINDPELLKQALVDIVNSTGDLAAIGRAVLAVVFGKV